MNKRKQLLQGLAFLGSLTALTLGCVTFAHVSREKTEAEYVSLPAAVIDEADISLAASDLYNAYAPVSAGADGVLHLSDNAWSDPLKVVRIAARHLSFRVPGCWEGRTAVRSLYTGDAWNGAESTPYGCGKDAEFIYVFERSCLTEEDKNRVPGKTGLLTMLAVVPAGSEGSLADDDAMVPVMTLTENGAVYQISILSPSEPSGDLSDEKKTLCRNLIYGADYMGCIISSMRATGGGTLAPANAYVQSAYIDGFDANGAGITEGSAVPSYIRETKADSSSDIQPSALPRGKTAYSWKEAAENPFSYSDGTIPTPTMTPTPTPTPTPTDTPTPAPTKDPETVPRRATPTPDVPDTPTPVPTSTPTPAASPESSSEIAGENS